MVEGQAQSRDRRSGGFGKQEGPEVASAKPPHRSTHGPTWQAATREGLEHLPHPWHNPHEAERQGRPWRWALQRTDTAAAGRGEQWAQAPVIQAGGRPRHPARSDQGRGHCAPLTRPGSLWESSREKCQRGRRGVVGSAKSRDAGRGRRDRPSLLR